MNGELRILNNVLVANWVSRFVAYDKENFKNNRILTYDGCFWFHWVANAKERAQERKLLRDSHVHCHETQSVHKLGWEIGWTHSLLSLVESHNQQYWYSLLMLGGYHLEINIVLFLKIHSEKSTKNLLRCLFMTSNKTEIYEEIKGTVGSNCFVIR